MNELFFYLFSVILIASAGAVILVRNPVHSVLFLILAFINAGCLFITMGAEFLAMMIVIVYVGAVAVLFLFVVMMLDINFKELRRGFARYMPVAMMIGATLLLELLLLTVRWQSSEHRVPETFIMGPSNTHTLGQVLYTDYALIFQLVGMVLLLAMIGAIVLTLRQRQGVKRQNVKTQLRRQRQEVVEVRKLSPTKKGE